MLQDPFTIRSTTQGCDSCKVCVPSCYAVNLSFSPRKLVRKRHRDLEQSAVYCMGCYDTEADLPILVDGSPVGLRKTGIVSDGCGLTCHHCRIYFRHNQQIFGMIASSLWMSGSCIESVPLASFCPDCIEKLTITLSPKI